MNITDMSGRFWDVEMNNADVKDGNQSNDYKLAGRIPTGLINVPYVYAFCGVDTQC